MRLFSLTIISFLLSFNSFSQKDTTKWFEGTFSVNTEKGKHSIWFGLTHLEVLYPGDKNFDNYIPTETGDSIKISYVDQKHLKFQLIRYNRPIHTLIKKVKLKEDLVIIKTKWIIRGIPPILWGLGWRASSIQKLNNNKFKVRQSPGGIAFLTLLPFTGRTPQIEDIILEK